MPPSCARAMARLASVTVSIAALSNGMLSSMSFVRRVDTSVSRGNTSEWAGSSSTSSNVKPSGRDSSSMETSFWNRKRQRCLPLTPQEFLLDFGQADV